MVVPACENMLREPCTAMQARCSVWRTCDAAASGPFSAASAARTSRMCCDQRPLAALATPRAQAFNAWHCGRTVRFTLARPAASGAFQRSCSRLLRCASCGPNGGRKSAGCRTGRKHEVRRLRTTTARQDHVSQVHIFACRRVMDVIQSAPQRRDHGGPDLPVSSTEGSRLSICAQKVFAITDAPGSTDKLPSFKAGRARSECAAGTHEARQRLQ